jgi:hypothetical protein
MVVRTRSVAPPRLSWKAAAVPLVERACMYAVDDPSVANLGKRRRVMAKETLTSATSGLVLRAEAGGGLGGGEDEGEWWSVV